MGRRRPPLRRRVMTPDALDVAEELALACGPSPLEDVEHLRDLWQAVGHEMVPRPDLPDGDLTHPAPGTRHWAWWAFEAGEDMPPTPGAQLARLRQLRALEPWCHRSSKNGPLRSLKSDPPPCGPSQPVT